MGSGTMRGLLAGVLTFGFVVPAVQARPHPGYRIPPDNPFIATPGARPEVYAYGLRNPYRWSFDVPTGDMYVADVGGTEREEVTYLPRDSIAGANLGWHCLEGTARQKPCKAANHFPPAHEYPSTPDVIIGGYVVHAPSLPSFQGRYLYGRYRSGIWLAGPQAAGPAVNLSAAVTGITSIGEDGAGTLYVTSYNGPVYRIGEAGGALTLSPVGTFRRPVQVVSVPGAPRKLLVVEKRGTVMLVDANGQVSEFLDITSRVRDSGYEEGLLGIEPAPDYASTGRAVAFYTDKRGDIQVDEYRRASRRPILKIRHNQSSHHHGGQMEFGSDGYLYLSTGDGDLEVDPQNDAQNLGSLLGKILRIDVSARRPDTRSPTLTARAPGVQRVLRRGVVVASVRSSERCSIVAGGRVSIGGRSYPLLRAGLAGRRGRFELSLRAGARHAVAGALRRRRPATAWVTVRAEDATGNATSVTLRIRVSG
jgi:glucose/arabinose dehydrogenase